jgi:hypothetical protein
MTKFSNENISFSKEIKIQDEIHTSSVGNIFLQDGENQIYEVEFEFLNGTGRIFKINFAYAERHL